MTSHTGSGTYPTKLLLQGLHLGSELRASCFCSSAQCTPVWLLLGLSFLSRWRSFPASFLSGLWTTGLPQPPLHSGERSVGGAGVVACKTSLMMGRHRQVVASAWLHVWLRVQ